MNARRRAHSTGERHARSSAQFPGYLIRSHCNRTASQLRFYELNCARGKVDLAPSRGNRYGWARDQSTAASKRSSKPKTSDEDWPKRIQSEGRLRLLDTNASVYKGIIPEVVKAAPEAVLLVVTDPPDPLAELTRQLAGHDRVLSTGTLLDSLRFRVHLAERLDVNLASVEAALVGEHGTSEVLLWSSARVGGVPIVDALSAGTSLDDFRKSVERDVRYANITIIEGNEASQFGIGIVSARISEAVLRDERSVWPIGAYNAEFGVTLSLPSVLGRQGVIRILKPAMSDAEQRALGQSAKVIRKAVERTSRTP
jgi:L-lactate dehydrogenase